MKTSIVREVLLTLTEVPPAFIPQLTEEPLCRERARVPDPASVPSLPTPGYLEGAAWVHRARSHLRGTHLLAKHGRLVA